MSFIEFSIEPQFSIDFSKNEPYQMNTIYYEW